MVTRLCYRYLSGLRPDGPDNQDSLVMGISSVDEISPGSFLDEVALPSISAYVEILAGSFLDEVALSSISAHVEISAGSFLDEVALPSISAYVEILAGSCLDEVALSSITGFFPNNLTRWMTTARQSTELKLWWSYRSLLQFVFVLYGFRSAHCWWIGPAINSCMLRWMIICYRVV